MLKTRNFLRIPQAASEHISLEALKPQIRGTPLARRHSKTIMFQTFTRMIDKQSARPCTGPFMVNSEEFRCFLLRFS